MKLIALCVVFVCIKVSVAGDLNINKNILSIKDVAQLDMKENVYVAELDFDMSLDITESEKDSLWSEAKDFADYQFNESRGNDTMSIPDTVIMKRETEKFYRFLVNTKIESYLFNQFSNKPYFDSKVDKSNCISLNLIKSRIDQLKSEILKTRIVINSENIFKALEGHTDLVTMPVAAFIIRDGVNQRWVIVRAWEDYEGDEIKRDQCLTLGHISGTVYDLNFQNEIIKFSCL